MFVVTVECFVFTGRTCVNYSTSNLIFCGRPGSTTKTAHDGAWYSFNGDYNSCWYCRYFIAGASLQTKLTFSPVHLLFSAFLQSIFFSIRKISTCSRYIPINMKFHFSVAYMYFVSNSKV